MTKADKKLLNIADCNIKYFVEIGYVYCELKIAGAFFSGVGATKEEARDMALKKLTKNIINHDK